MPRPFRSRNSLCSWLVAFLTRSCGEVPHLLLVALGGLVLIERVARQVLGSGCDHGLVLGALVKKGVRRTEGVKSRSKAVCAQSHGRVCDPRGSTVFVDLEEFEGRCAEGIRGHPLGEGRSNVGAAGGARRSLGGVLGVHDVDLGRGGVWGYVSLECNIMKVASGRSGRKAPIGAIPVVKVSSGVKVRKSPTKLYVLAWILVVERRYPNLVLLTGFHVGRWVQI